MDLREQKPPVFTNRDCIKKTWTEKGVAHISELALENAKALPGIIQWNHEHGIRFFRRARMPDLAAFYCCCALPCVTRGLG